MSCFCDRLFLFVYIFKAINLYTNISVSMLYGTLWIVKW